jgi:hypothetical protein
MPPLARKSLRIAALTLGALLLSALALGQTPNHPTPPCKALTTQSSPLPTSKPAPCHTRLHRPETSISLNASVTFRPLGGGGGGLDYLLTHHLTLRTEYRGQLYKFSDYSNALPRYLTVTSEPTMSVVYNFTHPK